MDINLQMVILGEILLAMFLGGLIGLERELANKPAGLRTHMVVSGAAALLVALGNLIIRIYSATLPVEYLRFDPVRVIEAIIVGISFLGAGTIFQRKRGEEVEGLTTASSILFTAGIGVAVALEQFVLAAGGAVLLLVVMRVLGMVEVRLLARRG